VTPPAETMPVGYDIYDYADYKSSGGDCTSDSDLAYWVELKAPMPDPAGSPVIYTLEAYRGESLQDLAFSRTGFLSETGQAKIELRLSAQELGGKSAPEAFCFHVETTDAAGNPAPTTSESPVFVCKPCNFRVSDAPNAGFGPPPEPMWNSGDSYPGGPCDPGGGTGGNFPDGGLTTGSGGSGGGGGGEDVVIGGCGCRVGGEGEGAGASLAALALLAGAAMRAKRRRAER
jgi:MYXO-CTERM domain-containing protein